MPSPGRVLFFRNRLPVLLWSALMLMVSSIPGDELPTVVSFWEWDKLAHFGEFFIFGVLASRWSGLGYRAALVPWLIVVGALFGGLDELHQLLIPNRDCTVQDFAADLLGVMAGVISYYLFRVRRVHANNHHR